ncbi:hypothetical protein SAMN06893096_110109 [Geodermatophilus pulveris]|uniref:Uncharacterized protein n=1 Tax=Geodermatophilus pulveris TaxID=1564159 RepID=A0A239IEE9_9ACTN|nr:hypothetical protein [Geodermatophilus pulveris]SNS91403.1 hypothetical protein SAMN06893096_110109 [Geodermatophilus pulveris]
MSATPGRRAAVFSTPSQDVEVLVDGVWCPGSLLGWRHDGGGACQVWVRVGADREVWTGLPEVRLPEADPAPVLVPDAPAALSLGPAEELLPGASAAPRLSLSEAAAREQRAAGVLPVAPRAATRRRHGGDVTAELPAATDAAAAAGRHRAGAAPGRHRALDARTQPEAPQTGAGAEPDLGDATVLMPRATGTDCLTRPMRLGDRGARPRPVRPDQALRA